jgi:hypothetical protein
MTKPDLMKYSIMEQKHEISFTALVKPQNMFNDMYKKM